ncbi:hypothetical protein GCM10023318_05090 [Nocardia callitridis]|uniref:Uncharacterized protein n=1 Tax=Nocardia callitridis TaxID=648753 RepID=A0ABP9JUE2_9NOCA
MGRASDDSDADDPRSAIRRARESARLARIFGEALPETTRDERVHDPEDQGSSEAWLRSQVPPHHG